MPTIGESARGARPLLDGVEQAVGAAKTARRSVPCRGCGARIMFVTKPTGGGLMPVDAAETTIAVEGDTPEAPWRLVKGHVPHHITCPNRADFRRPKS